MDNNVAYSLGADGPVTVVGVDVRSGKSTSSFGADGPMTVVGVNVSLNMLSVRR